MGYTAASELEWKGIYVIARPLKDFDYYDRAQVIGKWKQRLKPRFKRGLACPVPDLFYRFERTVKGYRRK